MKLCEPVAHFAESSFDATSVSALTLLPVYAASVVSYDAVHVSNRIRRVDVGVNVYQTEFSGTETPAWLGSPVSPVAVVVSPLRVPLALWSSVRTFAFAKLSFAGGGGGGGGPVMFSNAPIVGGLPREAPGRSMVMPEIDWPAPSSGEPASGRRSVADAKSGFAAIELASLWVSARQLASDVTSLTPTVVPKKLRKPPTLPVPVE